MSTVAEGNPERSIRMAGAELTGGLPFTILVVGLAAGPYTRPGLLVIARSCLAP